MKYKGLHFFTTNSGTGACQTRVLTMCTGGDSDSYLSRYMYTRHQWPLKTRYNMYKHLLRYWPIFARSSTLHFAGAVNTRQNMTVYINNLVPSEFPNRSSRSAMSLIGTLICILETRGIIMKIKHFKTEFEYFTPNDKFLDRLSLE